MINSSQVAPVTFMREDSWLKTLSWSLLNPFTSMGRLLIEAFIRRDMGERYFRRPAVIRVSLLLAFWPLVSTIFVSKIIALFFGGFSPEAEASGFNLLDFIYHYATWYLYLAAFFYASVQRLEEIKRLPSALDLERYSLSTGRIKEGFYAYKFWGKTRDERFIECWLEPAPFFLAGLVLAVLGQPLGWLLMFCSTAYSASYNMAYYQGDNIVMNTADAIILQKGLKKVIMEDADLQEAKGVKWRGQKPVDMATRREVLRKMMGEDDVFLVSSPLSALPPSRVEAEGTP